MVERAHKGRQEGRQAIDAVFMCTTICYSRSKRSPELLLVKQFRPPLNSQVVEFCAGLCDAGEDPETTARRELAEETGFTYGVAINGIHGPMAIEPGFSDSRAAMVIVDVDGDHPDNEDSRLQAHPEESEKIVVLRVPLAEAVSQLKALEADGAYICVAVWSYVLGVLDRKAECDIQGTELPKIRRGSEFGLGFLCGVTIAAAIGAVSATILTKK